MTDHHHCHCVSNVGILLGAELTLQDPVNLPMVSQPLQMDSDACQVDFVLLQGLAAATVQLDGPLQQMDKQVGLRAT